MSKLAIRIDKESQKRLFQNIVKEEWNLSLPRRTQHYGYEYDYNGGLKETKPIPEFLLTLIEKVEEILILIEKIKDYDYFNQIIINEYLPGQKINPHIDDEKLFDEIIVSISLGSTCDMILTKKSSKETKTITLEPGSILVLSGEYRYSWLHSLVNDNSSQSRISVTMRRVIS